MVTQYNQVTAINPNPARDQGESPQHLLSNATGGNVIMDFENGDKLKIRGGVTWLQEDFGLHGSYKNGTLALIGDSSELLELVC